ncbi:poly-gamma-glutamate synthesis protein (capsule biosynthesis protein) [Eubacterium ruminantium]|nr:poly-gamma-glutamate synthesis protein (capsule biosynthesis protein) [Eubacterium ruminantium]
MIFLGDLACPEQKIDDFIKCVNDILEFENEIIVINLEANIVDNNEERKELTLYNLSKITDAFKKSNRVIVSLANNHMYDYPEKILETKSILEKSNIATFGLYEGTEIKPYEFTDSKGRKYAFFGHCWRLYTNTNQNRVNNVRVVDCPYDEFLDIVFTYIKYHSDVETYCFMHWNYDLEKYPFPVHRELSHQLIDVGATAIIGSHSHRPQGFEIFKGHVIAYCLGNFYLPSGYYFDGKLTYPDYSKQTYGIRFRENKVDRIWFDTDKGEPPIRVTKIDEDIVHNHDFPDCIDMDEKVYKDFFKRNREKKFLVPVFTRIGGVKMAYQEAWAITRVKVLRKVKGWMRK